MRPHHSFEQLTPAMRERLIRDYEDLWRRCVEGSKRKQIPSGFLHDLLGRWGISRVRFHAIITAHKRKQRQKRSAG